jgi:hypothetical protein
MVPVMKELANNNITVKMAGLLAFIKHKDKFECKYRITYFGTLLLSPIINTQKVVLPKELEDLFIKVLNNKKVKFNQLTPDEKIIIEPIKNGSFVISFENIDIVMRKGKNSIQAMLPDIYLTNIRIYVNKYIKSS